MDTSKEYIKMCEKAGDIQALQPDCNNSLGSCYRYGNFPDDFYRHGRYSHKHVFVRVSKNPQERSIWLPRQDQLQEMILQDGEHDIHSLLRMFFKFYERPGDYDLYEWKGYSFEIIWLVFIMKEKFNKTWNGEAWI
jgi:hypothetical protein